MQPVGRFPSAQRVRRRAEFRAVQTNGRRVRTPHFVLLLYARRAVDAASPPRLGIVASRKIGNAVQRNRAKRLIREAFRATRPLWPSGMDVVVIVTRPVEKKLTEVVNEWRTAEPRVREQCRQARADAEARAARGED